MLIIQVVTVQSNETTVAIYGMNDMVLVTEVRRNILPEQVVVKLSGQTNFSSQTVHIFTMPCDTLSSQHSNLTVNIYSANTSVDHQDTIMSPTYLVSGSRIEVLTFIPDASVINDDINLYIFEGLDGYPNYASHLDKSTYQTSGPGMQNTSTLVNYTVQSTDYYFVVIDSNAPIIARFHITLYKQLYHDYQEVCAITGRTECSLQVFKHECVDILARSSYTHDLEWLPTHITATNIESGKYVIFAIILNVISGFTIGIYVAVKSHYIKSKGHERAPPLIRVLMCC